MLCWSAPCAIRTTTVFNAKGNFAEVWTLRPPALTEVNNRQMYWFSRFFRSFLANRNNSLYLVYLKTPLYIPLPCSYQSCRVPIPILSPVDVEKDLIIFIDT